MQHSSFSISCESMRTRFPSAGEQTARASALAWKHLFQCSFIFFVRASIWLPCTSVRESLFRIKWMQSSMQNSLLPACWPGQPILAGCCCLTSSAGQEDCQCSTSHSSHSICDCCDWPGPARLGVICGPAKAGRLGAQALTGLG